jgi:hypothetical protein
LPAAGRLRALTVDRLFWVWFEMTAEECFPDYIVVGPKDFAGLPLDGVERQN